MSWTNWDTAELGLLIIIKEKMGIGVSKEKSLTIEGLQETLGGSGETLEYFCNNDIFYKSC